MEKKKYDALKEFAHAYYWGKSDKYNWSDKDDEKLLADLKKKFFM